MRTLGRPAGCGALLLALLLCAAPAGAVSISLSVDGIVSFLDDPDGVLAGSGLAVGSPISATYRFESATPDANAGPALGDYLGALLAADVTLGSLLLSIDPAGAFSNRINVGDDFGGTNDFYLPQVDSALATLGGAPIDYGFFALALESSNPGILTGDALPLSIPGSGPADFDVQNLITVVGFSGGLGFLVEAVPTASTWTPIPEPSGFGLGVLGLLALGLRARAPQR